MCQPEAVVIAARAAKEDLKKLYNRLVKEHERVGLAFRNQQKQNKELAAEPKEKTKDLEEANNTQKSWRTWSGQKRRP